MSETSSLQAAPRPKVEATDVRYIKLGPGGAWFDHALANDMIELGHPCISHKLARAADAGRLCEAFRENGHGKTATAFANEVIAFATLPETTLWITFERGLMWWAHAAEELVHLATANTQHGIRARRLKAPWRSTDIAGAPLRIETLSGKLTSVAAYRRSVCQVKAASYALRRINALPSELGAQAEAARIAGISAARDMIRQLGPFDFEVLVDLIFRNSGWRRVSALGGFQTDSDLILIQPVTGERALVQVKSSADAKVFSACLKRYQQSSGLSHFFFVCHSPTDSLTTNVGDVHVWTSERLAELSVNAGLLCWLAERAE